MFNSDNQKNLWTQKEKMLVEKQKDKNPPVTLEYLEKKMSYYKEEIELLNEMTVEKSTIFYAVQIHSVIDVFRDEASDWLNRHGNVLRELGIRELNEISKEIGDYRARLAEDPDGIDDLKAMLNTIAIIRNESMMMEFRIAEVDEKFRTLDMFRQPVDPARRREAFSLKSDWFSLIASANSKDAKLVRTKEKFAQDTKEDVVKFKQGLKLLYEKYIEEGPGSPNTSLDDGLQLIEYYKEQAGELNKKKEDLVLAEKLFNIDISTFPELVAIEEESKALQPVYDLYAEIKTTLKEFEQVLWVKLDAENLKQAGDKFEKMRRRMASKYGKNPVFEKLETRIKSFKESIPLIQQLKAGNITERHW
jgi:dynein heavy chain